MPVPLVLLGAGSGRLPFALGPRGAAVAAGAAAACKVIWGALAPRPRQPAAPVSPASPASPPSAACHNGTGLPGRRGRGAGVPARPLVHACGRRRGGDEVGGRGRDDGPARPPGAASRRPSRMRPLIPRQRCAARAAGKPRLTRPFGKRLDRSPLLGTWAGARPPALIPGSGMHCSITQHERQEQAGGPESRPSAAAGSGGVRPAPPWMLRWRACAASTGAGRPRRCVDRGCRPCGHPTRRSGGASTAGWSQEEDEVLRR